MVLQCGHCKRTVIYTVVLQWFYSDAIVELATRWHVVTYYHRRQKQLQFLRNEYTHKKEEQAATYDVVGARPSCIWKARWSVVSFKENQSFSK